MEVIQQQFLAIMLLEVETSHKTLRALFERAETQVRTTKRKWLCGWISGAVAIIPADK